MAWYSHLLKKFPEFVVVHTVKGFGIASKAKVDVFLELSCFFDDPVDVGNLMSCSSAFSKTWKHSCSYKHLLENDILAQLCPTLCDPMDYTVHGILQAKILEWVAFPFARGSSQPKD